MWGHWSGVLVWLVGFSLIHALSKKYLPNRDPFLLPIGGLLSAWGLLTIWRLYPDLGLRQSIWLAISLTLVATGIRFHQKLFVIRKYKYLWLTGSLVLTASTLVWGSNPMGYGPEMWLGCCGIYLQPSEPLKFMLIAYLAAYLAEQQPFLLLTTIRQLRLRANRVDSGKIGIRAGLLPLLAPTLVMFFMTVLLLVIQQDLGTAAVFLLIYAVIIYVASADFRVIWLSLIGLLIAALVGYQLFNVVQIRFEAWLNPFLDPSGNSYQIVQSLIALANGELFGRGLGVGYPNLVPVSHSDFIFTSIVEESGFLGGMAIVFCLVIFFYRGLLASIKAGDAYRRYLGIGLVTYLIGQSILIIGGNLRLLPLTGITLPFISYGGSSLVVSFLSLLFLVLISNRDEEQPATVHTPRVYRNVGSAFLIALAATGILIGWWSLLRSPALLTRTDNPRRGISDRRVRRGSILDRHNVPMVESVGQAGDFRRVINLPSLSNILGYTNPIYGQAGLEANMDRYLRGIDGNPALDIWWNRLLYGFPPTGHDIRTSIDLALQSSLEKLMEPHKGAAILINAKTGEILAMASSPSFDANHLDEHWNELVNDPDAPLINRAVQGYYPVGGLTTGVFQQFYDSGVIGPVPQIRFLNQPLFAANIDFKAASPLQIALLCAAISGGGAQPAPVLVMAVDSNPDGWIIMPPLEKTRQLISQVWAVSLAGKYGIPQDNIWQNSLVATKPTGGSVTWFVAGTAPGWEGTPLAITVLLESDSQTDAIRIGRSLLLGAMHP